MRSWKLIALQRPLFSLLNTFLAESLKRCGCHFNWTSLWVYWKPKAVATSGSPWIGSAALLALPGTARIKFSQRRTGDVVFERAVGDAPFVFDSSAPFGFAYDSSPVSVLLAFQHAAREKVSSKTRGRMKATGCVMDDSVAWFLPRRITFDITLKDVPGVVYIGAGSKAHRVSRSTWSRHLGTGPGLNRAQALELFEARAREDTALLGGLKWLEGSGLMCHSSASQRCHGDVLAPPVCRTEEGGDYSVDGCPSD